MEEVKVEELQEKQVGQAGTAEQSSHSDDDGDETGSDMYTEDEDSISVNGDGDKKKKKVGRLSPCAHPGPCNTVVDHITLEFLPPHLVFQKKSRRKKKPEAAGPGVGGSQASDSTPALRVDKLETEKRWVALLDYASREIFTHTHIPIYKLSIRILTHPGSRAPWSK